MTGKKSKKTTEAAAAAPAAQAPAVSPHNPLEVEAQTIRDNLISLIGKVQLEAGEKARAAETYLGQSLEHLGIGIQQLGVHLALKATQEAAASTAA